MQYLKCLYNKNLKHVIKRTKLSEVIIEVVEVFKMFAFSWQITYFPGKIK